MVDRAHRQDRCRMSSEDHTNQQIEVAALDPSITLYCSFTGVIDPNSAQRIAAMFNHAHNNGFKTIYVCFNSPGGTVNDGIFLYNHIVGLPIHVIMHNVGTVGSIAAAIYVAADERRCSKHGTFIIHPTSVQPQHNMEAESLIDHLRSLLADDQRIDDILREKTVIPDDLLQTRRRSEVLITAQQALEFGVAHTLDEFALPQGVQIFQI